MHTGEVCRIAVLGKTDSPVRGGRVWSNPDLYPIGRAGIALMRRTERRKHIKRPVAGRSKPFRNCEVRMPISNSEMASEGMQAVRQVHSSNELPVMGRDAKGPDFRHASDRVSWRPKSRSVAHG